jgi:hypothetical protein
MYFGVSKPMKKKLNSIFPALDFDCRLTVSYAHIPSARDGLFWKSDVRRTEAFEILVDLRGIRGVWVGWKLGDVG